MTTWHFWDIAHGSAGVGAGAKRQAFYLAGDGRGGHQGVVAVLHGHAACVGGDALQGDVELADSSHGGDHGQGQVLIQQVFALFDVQLQKCQVVTGIDPGFLNVVRVQVHVELQHGFPKGLACITVQAVAGVI